MFGTMDLNITQLKEERGIKAITVENTWLEKRYEGIPEPLLSKVKSMLTHGWGNGYISLPKDHPWYTWITSSEEKTPGNRYVNVYRLNVNVHGGITFGDEDDDGDYWIGFDTSHAWDNMENWPKERVEEATLLLWQQAIDAYNNPHNKSFDPNYHEESIKCIDTMIDKTLDIFN